MSAIANAMILRELSNAMNALKAPFSVLPEVKNHNGEPITDVKDKRLALAEKHIQSAGDIVNVVEQTEAALEQGIEAFLAQKFRPEIEAEMKKRGVSPAPNGAFAPPMPVGACNCPACTGEPDEPGRTVGFGTAIK